MILLLLASTLLFALPQGIETAIKHSGLPKKDISLYIKEAGSSHRVVAALNASEPRTPASVIKVLSTYAAVLKLGFDYRWPTQFYRNGRVKNGVLHGDLVVKGFGDPTLNDDDLKEIVAQIKAKGIRKITGNIIIDRSYFKVGNANSAHFDENPYSPYNALPDAMMFNERVSTICVVPSKHSVTKKNPDKSYVIHNQLQHVNKPCRGRYSWPRIKVDDSKAVPEVWLKGKISNRCRKREICKVVTQPYKSFYYGLKAALLDAGIVVSGTMKLQKVPANARILFTHYSEPLEKIVSKTAKKSNNLYARHLLLYLGAKVYGAPGTIEKGRRAVLNILQRHGALGEKRVKLDNGCGLSRSAKLTAEILAKILDDAYGRYGMRWMQTLAIAGVDGTIKKRFRGTIVRKRAWMKTGTLKYAKNIAGYVKSRNGRYYTVVILVNTHKGRWKASKLENEILKWLVTYKGRGIVIPKKEPVSSPPSVPSAKKVTERGGYFIQAGSFGHVPSEGFIHQLEQLSLPYHVEHEDVYKVLIGPYQNEEVARKDLKKVRDELNLGAFLVPDGYTSF